MPIRIGSLRPRMKRLSRPLERLSELNERAQDLIARTYMAIAPLVPSSVRPIGWRSWAVIRHFVEDAAGLPMADDGRAAATQDDQITEYDR
jgi:hypothetical protein